MITHVLWILNFSKLELIDKKLYLNIIFFFFDIDKWYLSYALRVSQHFKLSFLIGGLILL